MEDILFRAFGTISIEQWFVFFVELACAFVAWCALMSEIYERSLADIELARWRRQGNKLIRMDDE